MKCVCSCLVLGMLSTAAFAQSRLFFVPAGVDPTTTTAGSNYVYTVPEAELGTDLTVEAFFEDVTGAAGFTVAWTCGATSSKVGRPDVTYVAGSAGVDTLRSDYFFFGIPGFAAIDQGQCNSVFACTTSMDCPGSSQCVANLCTVLQPRTGGVALVGTATFPEARYSGNVDFNIPSTAAGVYTVGPVCCAKGPGGLDADCDNTADAGCALGLTVLQDATVANQDYTVDKLELNVPNGDCCVGLACTPDVNEGECTALGGSFREGGDCSAACECATAANCDDGNACTVDTCAGIGNLCSDGGAANSIGCCNVDNTPSGLCCDTTSGAVANPDDSNPCTTDDCSGPNGTPANTPVTDGPNAGCDDGAVCTLDECLSGACANTDISSIPCTTIADCPGAASDCTAGFCVCVENPGLCLDYASGTDKGGQQCFAPGDIVMVDVNMAFSTSPVCGAQIFLQYDESSLELINIVKGADVDPVGSAVFNTVLWNQSGGGTIDYAVGDDPLGNCGNATNGPATIARLRFLAVGECKAQAPVCFRGHNPPTFLGADNGAKIVPADCNDPLGPVTNTCSGTINVTEGPTVTCPDSITLNADCGAKRATHTFDPIVFEDDCEGELAANCTLVYYPWCEDSGDCGGGNCVGGICDILLPGGSVCNDPALGDGGGQFCRGRTVISCDATDKCNNSAACSFEVVNTGLNTLNVAIELSPQMDAGNAFDPLVRCTDITLGKCGSGSNVAEYTEKVNITYGQPDNIAGHGVATLKVPSDNWDCITVRDQWHTLAATCGVECVDNAWSATFKGSPALAGGACHWLVGGNLNGDPVIDILDFVAYLTQNNSSIDPDIPCGSLDKPDNQGNGDLHADINGDGLVDMGDFAFIAVNFFDNDKAGCELICNPGAASTPATPRASISVREVAAIYGADVAAMADTNNDKVVDVDDMIGFINTADRTIDLAPSLDAARGVSGLK